MPAHKDGKDIVKIAVEMENQIPQLMQLDQKRPLKQIIQDLCGAWNTEENSEEFSLQFYDRELKYYVTEKNRNEVKDGTVLKLIFSPARTASDILEVLRYKVGEERRESLKRLVKFSSDTTFATEFINKQGKDYLASAIEQGSIRADEGLGLALESLVELLNHGICGWDSVDSNFIKRIATQVNSAATTPPSDPRVLINSLAILENIVNLGGQLYTVVEPEVALTNLIAHVQKNSSTPEVQQNSLALINALFSKSDLSKRQAMAATLSSRHVRSKILNSVLSSVKSDTAVVSGINASIIGSEMAHQLYVLQSLMFNLHEERTKVNPQTDSKTEADSKEKVNELRKLAFDSDMVAGTEAPHRSKNILLNGSTNFQDDYVKLGFENCKNPIDDFSACPPGLLALDLITYFAINYTETYIKVVLENCCRADREHECPFIRSSNQLTDMICDILKICEPPSEEGKLFYPMFFTHDSPLEEFFVICVILLNKTWKEMRATVEDFAKVFAVIRQQITRALADNDATTTFEKFRNKLATLSYAEIMNLWQKERIDRQTWENKAVSIIELREAIKPEIIELVKQQRLLFLTDGTLFVKYSSKGQRIKDKFWFCRLSSNFKVFHYGDCDENKIPTIDELGYKLPLVDIKAMVSGKDCSHMKESKSKKPTFALAFSLILDSEQDEPLNFVAPNEKSFAYWTDGVNALLGKDMVSSEYEHDLETLLSMEIKLRLLDTEGVTIPKTPPEVPPPPPNYDFNLKY
ncbi:Engulfment and cell motility protein 1 [Halotydeus destructor]|nr:Engulfment and cell motility protein 1 [Halotydeus destructor]